MLFREAIASLLAAALFFFLVLLVLLASSESDANDSWHRGSVMVPAFFVIAVPIIWACGRYLLSKGLRKPLHFIAGAFVLTAGLIAVFVTPAIVIGGVIGFVPWGWSITAGLVVALSAAASSLPSAFTWWWVVAHNQ